MNTDKIARFAHSFGYDGAKYRGQWEHYDVYEPTVKHEKPSNIGKPEFILVFGSTIRMATEEEVFAYIDSLPDEDY